MCYWITRSIHITYHIYNRKVHLTICRFLHRISFRDKRSEGEMHYRFITRQHQAKVKTDDLIVDTHAKLLPTRESPKLIDLTKVFFFFFLNSLCCMLKQFLRKGSKLDLGVALSKKMTVFRFWLNGTAMSDRLCDAGHLVRTVLYDLRAWGPLLN